MSSASAHSTSGEDTLTGALDLGQSPTFSGNEEEVEDDQAGGYSTRMEELLSDGDDEHGDAETDGDYGGFVYDGVDADQITGDNYRDQLRDVLGPDDSYDESEEQEVEQALLQESNSASNDLPRDVPVSRVTPHGLDMYSCMCSVLIFSWASTLHHPLPWLCFLSHIAEWGLLRRTAPSYNYPSHSYTQTSPDFVPLRQRAPLLPALGRLMPKL